MYMYVCTPDFFYRFLKSNLGPAWCGILMPRSSDGESSQESHISSTRDVQKPSGRVASMLHCRTGSAPSSFNMHSLATNI